MKSSKRNADLLGSPSCRNSQINCNSTLHRDFKKKRVNISRQGHYLGWQMLTCQALSCPFFPYIFQKSLSDEFIILDAWASFLFCRRITWFFFFQDIDTFLNGFPRNAVCGILRILITYKRLGLSNLYCQKHDLFRSFKILPRFLRFRIL